MTADELIWRNGGMICDRERKKCWDKSGSKLLSPQIMLWIALESNPSLRDEKPAADPSRYTTLPT
jgi:hypothetical protein